MLANSRSPCYKGEEEEENEESKAKRREEERRGENGYLMSKMHARQKFVGEGFVVRSDSSLFRADLVSDVRVVRE